MESPPPGLGEYTTADFSESVSMERRKNLTLNDELNTENNSGEANDNALIKALRSQIRDLQEAAKAVPDRATLEAEIRETLARDQAIVARLESHKLPAGILESVKIKLGDAKADAASVDQALVAIGFQVEGAAGGEDQTNQSQQQQSDLASVKSLSDMVQSTAGGGAPASSIEAVNQAQTRAELIEAARRGGYLSE